MEDLLRKVPPADMRKTMDGLEKSSLDPKAKEKLDQEFPVPFAVCTFDGDTKGKSFIMCRQNKVKDGEYRSPWSNKVYKKGGVKTSTKSNQTDEMLLELEKKFNTVWSAYAKLYYGAKAVSSCFLGETEEKKFQAVFCIHKACDEGAWHSYHTVLMDDPEEKTCQYHVTSSVWVKVDPDCSEYTDPTTVDASALLTKSVSKVMKIERFFLTEFHLQNIGSIVEAVEIEIRSNLEQVLLPKTKDIMDTIQKEPEQPRQRVNPLMGMIMDSNVLKKKKLGQQG